MTRTEAGVPDYQYPLMVFIIVITPPPVCQSVCVIWVRYPESREVTGCGGCCDTTQVFLTGGPGPTPAAAIRRQAAHSFSPCWQIVLSL